MFLLKFGILQTIVRFMVSFIDWFNNGVFDLVPYNSSNLQNEYISINAVTYDESPNPNIARTNGMMYKNIYDIWPILATGGMWDPNNLPSSILRINWGTVVTKRLAATLITDAYGRFGGSIDQYIVHPDHHNITLVKTNESTKSFRLVNGNDGGVTYSDDKGISFKWPRNGYNTTQFYGVDKMNGADRLYRGNPG